MDFWVIHGSKLLIWNLHCYELDKQNDNDIILIFGVILRAAVSALFLFRPLNSFSHFLSHFLLLSLSQTHGTLAIPRDFNPETKRKPLKIKHFFHLIKCFPTPFFFQIILSWLLILTTPSSSLYNHAIPTVPPQRRNSISPSSNPSSPLPLHRLRSEAPPFQHRDPRFPTRFLLLLPRCLRFHAHQLPRLQFSPLVRFWRFQIRCCCKCHSRPVLIVRNGRLCLGDFKRSHSVSRNPTGLVRFQPWSGVRVPVAVGGCSGDGAGQDTEADGDVYGW